MAGRVRPRVILVLALIVCPVLLYLARAPLLTAAARLLIVDDAREPADYLVVLGGGPDTRPFLAAALYRRGLAPRVIIFEYKRSRITHLGLWPAQHELYRQVLQLEGVPAGRIEQLPGVVDSTWHEARALRRYVGAHGARRIIVVTSPEHTRRAQWVFQKALAGTAVDVRMAAAPHPRYNETNWWKHDGSTLAYLHEYLKLPFYWFRYLFSGGPVRGTAAVPASRGAAS